MPDKCLIFSEVRKMAKNLDMRISEKAIIDTNDRVAELLKKAAYRAKENGRKTIMVQDL